MKKLLLSPLVCLICLLSQSIMAQTVVYTNSFPGTGGVGPFPGGTPSLLFTQTQGSSSAAPGSASGTQIGGPVGSLVLTDNQLGAWTTVAHVLTTTNNGYASATAPLSGYSAPFNTTLSLNTQLLTWTFNMQTGATATGFGAGQHEAAVVMAATSANIRSAGNGYAVIFNPSIPGGLQLVRYAGGLTGAITPMISTGSALTSSTNYASVRVTYDPTSNQWTLYIRDDGAGAFADPSTGVSVAVGSITDGTYTAVAMSSFGFYANYAVTYTGSGPDAKNAYFDSYSASLSCPDITGGLNTCVGLTTDLDHPFPGGVWTSGATGIASVDASTGIVTGVSAGTAEITYTVGTCVVTAIVTVNPLPIPPPVSGALSVCAGSTTTLSVSPATVGSTWSSSTPAVGTISASGVVAGITSGTTMISYTVPTGCFSVATVTVNPVAPISGFPLMCEGDSTTFTNSVAGGTWSCSDLSVALIDPSTGRLGAVTAGTAYITYTTSGSCVSTVMITVNALPAPITGTPTVCQGMSTTLSSATPGGFWSSSSGTVASVTSTGVVVGGDVGTSLITYKLTTGCLVTMEVTVNAQPLGIGGTLVICAESNTTLTNSLPGGSWSSSDVTVGTIDTTTGVFHGLTAGTTMITYMMPTGCFRTAIATVNPTPTPISGLGSVCIGMTITLTSSAGGTWQSSTPGVGTVGAGTGIVGGITSGTTIISYSYSTGCRRTTTVTVAPLPPAITGSTTVCTGRTTDLDNTSLGGTWSSSVVAVGTVNSGNGIVAGLTVGTTTIVYTIGTGCSASIVVSVIASPPANTGIPVVCVGDVTVLSNTTAGGTWLSSASGTASVDASGNVTGNAGGTCTITYTAPNGCFTTTTLTVNSLPGVIGGTLTVCANSNTTLTSSPGGGTWSSSTGAVGTISLGGGVLTGISAGTTTITYTRLGCIRTAIATVNPQPTAFTPTTNALCVGTTLTLNSTPAGGTWSSSNTTDAPIGASSGVITGNNAAVVTITYLHPTNGCTRTRSVTVNPLPGTIGGPSTLCPATTITCTTTSTGGTWSSSTPATGTIVAGTGVLTGIATGVTTITYTLPTGCIRTTQVTVSVAPVAILTPIGDTIMCPGDFVTLTSTTTAGVTYSWYKGGVLIAGATAPTYTTSVSGSYQIRVSATAGCSTLSSPMTVSVVPATATITLPGGSSVTCAGTPVTLNANTGTGLTYQWELGGIPIPGATASTYGATTAGNYTVRVTNSAGCWAISTPVAITVSPAPSPVVVASGPLTFCNGSSVTFSAGTGTGYTYQWYNSAGAIPGATLASYAATVSESYHVVITSTTGCSTTTAPSVVAVNPLPNVAITPGGPKVFCSGGVVSLSAAPGFTYQWYRDGVALTGSTAVVYAASIGGGYRVRVTNALTGCTDMTHADTVVSVVGAVAVLPLTPAKFCWGGSALLATSVSSLGAAVNYQWSYNSVVIPGATNATYNATVAGNYSCSIAVPSSCTVASSTVAVTQVPLPDPPITYTGTSLKTGNYYVTYQWYKNLAMIPGATSNSTPSTGPGNYKVGVTDTNGCQSISAVYVLTNGGGTTGVANVNSSDIRIFPNPAFETVFIESSVNVRAVITTVDGKTMINQENAKEISLKGLADGLYIITLFDENGRQVTVQKLIKQQ